MTDAATAVIVDMARVFLGRIREIAPRFERAFYRFRSEPSVYGSNASYVVNDNAQLMDALQYSDLFNTLNDRGRELFDLLGKPEGVMLLTVDSGFDYKIEFEWLDLDRWKITKLDGATGIPAGL